jgi:hypothetical protein
MTSPSAPEAGCAAMNADIAKVTQANAAKPLPINRWRASEISVRIFPPTGSWLAGADFAAGAAFEAERALDRA